MNDYDDDYSLEVYDEDCDDCGDYDDYEYYYQAWGWRYNLRNLRYKIGWWFWWHFGHCKTCGKRNVNCQCIRF